MAPRLRFLLLALALVLAGCASPTASHGEPELLLGLVNEMGAPVNASWSVVSPTSEVVWQANASIAAGKTVEKLQALAGEGGHTIRVTWDGGEGTAAYDPSECSAMLHVVLTLAPEGLAETKRECHTDVGH